MTCTPAWLCVTSAENYNDGTWPRCTYVRACLTHRIGRILAELVYVIKLGHILHTAACMAWSWRKIFPFFLLRNFWHVRTDRQAVSFRMHDLLYVLYSTACIVAQLDKWSRDNILKQKERLGSSSEISAGGHFAGGLKRAALAGCRIIWLNCQSLKNP